jgi:hypothetical protein
VVAPTSESMYIHFTAPDDPDVYIYIFRNFSSCCYCYTTFITLTNIASRLPWQYWPEGYASIGYHAIIYNKNFSITVIAVSLKQKCWSGYLLTEDMYARAEGVILRRSNSSF